jgi:HSP20 family protein
MTINGETGTKLPSAGNQRPDAAGFGLRQAINKLFDDFSTMPSRFEWPPMRFGDEFGNYMPRCDVTETDKEVMVTAELPGMEAANIEVTLVGDQLVIKGEKKAEREEKTAAYHRVERSYGSFERAIALPAEVVRDKIEATYKDGVLRVHMEKTARSADNVRKIEVKS